MWIRRSRFFARSSFSTLALLCTLHSRCVSSSCFRLFSHLRVIPEFPWMRYVHLSSSAGKGRAGREWIPQYSPFFCFFVHGTPVESTVAIHTPGILACSYPLLIEYNPFSIRAFKKFLSSAPPPSQQPSVRHMYIPIKSARNAAPIASLKSDHNRFSLSSADSTDSASSSISCFGSGFGSTVS